VASREPPGHTDDHLQDLVSEVDTGARAPTGAAAGTLLGVSLLWSLFQLWYASPLPFLVARIGIPVLNDTQARSIHLAFAVFLAFTAFPAFRRSPRDKIPLLDWLLAGVAAFAAGYFFLFYRELAERPGAPITIDLIVAVAGMVLLLEATRRALGPPLTIVALIFLLYVFGGPHMPDVIAHKGASLSKTMSHQWLTTEGVFGVALGVSTSFVFLFVLFGSMLDRAGAGNYFIKVAFAMLGHMRGGPAKAAVLSSGLTGLISGSSIANVVTTGTFTIPLMKRVGFPPEKAGAVEVASSVNGQLMPPVMGAAAFLMVEYVGISYVDVIRHAFLPAVISYVALLYIVHLEALKADMQGLPRRKITTLTQGLISAAITLVSLVLLSGLVYWGIGWIKGAFGAAATPIVICGVAAIYVVLLWYAARYPDLELDDANAPVVELPELGPTVKTGLHYLLPVILLIWCLMIERLSPGLSAFWASTFMIAILLTQRPITAAFRGGGGLGAAAWRGVDDLVGGLVAGARNMIGIGVATATAGIVVGTVSLTGIGLVMTEFVEFISGGSVILMLIFTAFISLILGMGLPTTANYIVVATLMAPVVVTLGAESGLVVPLIAVHLFVFYFGIMADVTPPVGLASFAAAAVSGADPIRTGVAAFYYSMRTVALPFIFIFNTELLMIGVESWADVILVAASATVAMLVFAAATQGWFVTRSRLWESACLLLVAFTLFRPGYWMDMIAPPTQSGDPLKIAAIAEGLPAGASLRIRAEGLNIDGDEARTTAALPLGPPAPGAERLKAAGLVFRIEGGKVRTELPEHGSAAARAGIDFDWTITDIELPADQPARRWMFIPALVLLGLVALIQRRRHLASAALVAMLFVFAGTDPAHADSRVPETIPIPAGPYIAGSDRAEREAAYRLDEQAYGHGVTRDRRWYESEPARTTRTLPAFHITRTQITNVQYAAFTRATGHAAPDVDAKTWAGYRLVHPFSRTRRHAWSGGAPPAGRAAHPVVLVSHADANAYARWLSEATGAAWRLPSEAEWEKAARGVDARRFPWGEKFDPARLNNADRGPFDTVPVGTFPSGASPFGLLDAAGQVFEWTTTGAGGGRFIVKGGSWDDKGCGICRPAARHSRPQAIRHILIGFRLVREVNR